MYVQETCVQIELRCLISDNLSRNSKLTLSRKQKHSQPLSADTEVQLASGNCLQMSQHSPQEFGSAWTQSSYVHAGLENPY